MDTPTSVGIALSILSILISVALTIVGFFFASKISKNNDTLMDIHTKLDTVSNVLLTLLQDSMKSSNTPKGLNTPKEGEVHIEENSKEKEEQLKWYEALQMMRQTLTYPAPVLSKEKKIGERKEHG